MHNRNTHHQKSLTDAFGGEQGRKVWRRFTVHYASRVVGSIPAAREASFHSRQCPSRNRVATLIELFRRTRLGTHAPIVAVAASTGPSPPLTAAASSLTHHSLRLIRCTSVRILNPLNNTSITYETGQVLN
jgi:hypothetical protein